MENIYSAVLPNLNKIGWLYALGSLALGLFLAITFNTADSPIWAGIAFIACVIFICAYYRGKESIEFIVSLGTLSGVGLTFLGLVIALSKLQLGDSVTITESISGLLSGIYPAFFSSVAGIVMALTTHWFPNFWKKDKSIENATESLDIDSQILRELKEINKSFNKFAEKMAEQNMNALKEVIADFNTKLQEQFGENFKQLNEAVAALLDWQENYKITIEETQSNLKQINSVLKNSDKAVQKISEAMERIEEHSATFKNISESISVALKDLEEPVEQSKQFAGELSQFTEKLEGVPRRIEDSMKESYGKVVDELYQNLKGISEKLVEDYAEVQAAMESIKKFNNK